MTGPITISVFHLRNCGAGLVSSVPKPLQNSRATHTAYICSGQCLVSCMIWQLIQLRGARTSIGLTSTVQLGYVLALGQGQEGEDCACLRECGILITLSNLGWEFIQTPSAGGTNCVWVSFFTFSLPWKVLQFASLTDIMQKTESMHI